VVTCRHLCQTPGMHSHAARKGQPWPRALFMGSSEGCSLMNLIKRCAGVFLLEIATQGVGREYVDSQTQKGRTVDSASICASGVCALRCTDQAMTRSLELRRTE
jgi:hypothetical protein